MAADDFELVTLRNGFRAVRHKGHDEVMHPSVGPWAEANQLYVEQAGLDALLLNRRSGPVRIYDVGLGAAANAVAALTRWAELGKPRALEIQSFEIDLTPLRLAVEDEAGFPFLAPWQKPLRQLMEQGEYRDERLNWKLHLGDALQLINDAPAPATLLFHDPFSPESNGTLWTPEVFKRLRAKSTAEGEGTRLYTYSASTRTRVSLLLGGFYVGTGRAIGTKQETTVAATRRDLIERPLDERWLQRWERSSSRAPWGEELTAATETVIRQHPQFWK